jgi:hypothetical protein
VKCLAGGIVETGITLLAQFAIYIAADVNAVEQGVRRGVSKGGSVLEDDQPAHGRRTIVFEQVFERFEEKLQIAFGKTRKSRPDFGSIEIDPFNPCVRPLAVLTAQHQNVVVVVRRLSGCKIGKVF